ncbi:MULTISPECIES: hypothetical protein [Spirosoma]|uniref:Lipocalin-like domain-containing protein n=1 Tax=Spirosoma liriopis TaxID=2937440 RepID=A0ABT0HRV5_9BACT|nr:MULTISPECIES: hypothetical protein [Spirosoma]MCK8494913.1 hypothetical protein [Spirosoma liriopis]UHG94018.1 hypothetical protein LQ777_25960 [Spirosoma oryzicola]
MIKRFSLFVVWLWVNACSSPPNIAPSSRIAGSYKFTQYSTASKDDLAPVGLVTLTVVDEQHIDLIVKGSSGKSKIDYSYHNVDVVNDERNYLGEDTFSLIYKKSQIGIVTSNEQGHYISLTPKPYTTLLASLPGDEDW